MVGFQRLPGPQRYVGEQPLKRCRALALATF